LKTRSARLKEALLVGIAISAPVLIADLTLKALRLPRSSARTMLLAGSPLYTSNQGYRRYAGNRTIEQSAVYGATIAYRYQYASNNKGLISAENINPGQSINLAIAGDSFGEGQGGFPWIKSWQRELQKNHQIRSINYSIAGSGFEDFAITAEAAKTDHNAKKVLILFIEHDAYRPYQPMGSNQHCSFYSNGLMDHLPSFLVCNLYGIVWHHVPKGLKNQDLIEASLKRQHYGVVPALNQVLIKVQANRFRPPKTAALTEQSQQQAATESRPRFGSIPNNSISALNRIKALYGQPNVLLVQLPDQPQSHTKTIALTSFQRQLVSATGLKLIDLSASCPLESSDFHELDNHPNQSGYSKLLNCLRSQSEIEAFVHKP